MGIITIRLAEKVDLEIITKLRYDFLREVGLDELIYTEFQEQNRLFLQNNTSTLIYILDLDEKAIGICMVTISVLPPVFSTDELTIGYLTNMFVEKEKRNKQYGKKFLEYIENDLRKQGVRKVILQSTKLAINFYLSNGFINKDYYVMKFS